MTGQDFAGQIRDTLEPLMRGADRVALFDFPTYDNVGDHAIWLGQVHFLRQTLGKRIIASGHCGMELLPDLATDVPILLQGGGNLGDLWVQHESFRLRVIERYPEHRIIILPQSIHFSSPEALERSADITSRHPDLHICVRDLASRDTALRMLSSERVWLCPDMALAMVALERPVPPQASFYALKRADIEAADFGEFPSDLQSGDWVGVSPTRLGRAVAAYDRWQMRYPNRSRFAAPLRMRLYDSLATQHLNRGLRQLSSAKVVITDRLHAHLLSSMMGIPHVVLDNSYGKISRFRELWGTGEGLCHAASTWDEAAATARALLDEVDGKAP